MNKLNSFPILFLAIVILSGCTFVSSSQTQQQSTQVVSSTAASFNYDDYSTVLKTYVNEQGLVDYQGLQANREKLDAFNASLAAVTQEQYSSWSEKEQIAFWMNAYNAFTLQSIIDQNPLKKSIRDIPGVWKRRKFDIAGQSKTLDNIEHKTLRVDFNEPRLHVALVCAAISCPPLLNEPYTAEKLDAQLDERVRNFLTSPHGFRIDRQEGRVYLSSIFKWYGKDWQQSYSAPDKFTGNDSERAVLNFFKQLPQFGGSGVSCTGKVQD